MPPRVSSSRKRPASPSPNVNVDLTAQNEALQEQVKLLKLLYEQSIRKDAVTTQRLDRVEAKARARGPGSAAGAALASVNDGEVRRLREQNEGLLKSLAASNEAAEQARVAARKAEAELVDVRAARLADLHVCDKCGDLFRSKEEDKSNPGEQAKLLRISFIDNELQVTLHISPSATVSVVRAELCALWGRQSSCLRLVFEDQFLYPSDIIKSYGLEDGDEVNVFWNHTGSEPEVGHRPDRKA